MTLYSRENNRIDGPFSTQTGDQVESGFDQIWKRAVKPFPVSKRFKEPVHLPENSDQTDHLPNRKYFGINHIFEVNQSRKKFGNSTISMSKIRLVLRMYSQGRSKPWIAEQTSVSRNTPKKFTTTFGA